MSEEKLTHFCHNIWWSEGPLRCLFCEKELDSVFEYSSPDRRYVIRSCSNCMDFIDDMATLAQYLRCPWYEIQGRQLIRRDSKHGRDVREILP